MPTIADLTHGYDATGALQYLEDLKSNVIEKAASEIVDKIENVNQVLDRHWVGMAADGFKSGTRESALELATALRGIKENLDALFNDMQEEFERNDRSMIDGI